MPEACPTNCVSVRTVPAFLGSSSGRWAAERLRPALAGAELLRFDAPRLAGDRPRPGAVIEEVEAVGKHLLVHFAGGLSLDTHMRMTGSWHLYRTGERWQRPRHLLRCRLVVPGWEAV